MPKPRDFLPIPQAIVHVYNRGVDRRLLFHRPRDYEIILDKFLDAKQKTNVSILVHTLMPNHVHLVLQQHEPFAIAEFMQRACFAFARWSNKRADRNGPLFEGPYGDKEIPDAQALLRVSHYILMNPVHAGLAEHPGLWKYSGYQSCLDGSNGSLDDPSLLLALTGGREQFGKFLEEFDGADPESVDKFLCPEYGRIWVEEMAKRPRTIIGKTRGAATGEK
jgi:REP element-mobilizing transposase RayT